MSIRPPRSTGVSLEDLSIERGSVLRLCVRLTGSPDAAEDLAQETFFLAWRHERELRDPDKRLPWLLGIAQNLCLRWHRERGRELARAARSSGSVATTAQAVEDLPEEGVDLAVELEREELADLLDRALALLPPAPRDVLVQSYMEELSHTEIGSRLRLSESAVKARLHRGRIALRRVLTSELRDEAAAYGLCDPAIGSWQETRVWCSECGRRQLMVRFAQPAGPVSFRCPACNPDPEDIGLECRLANAYFGRLVGGLTRPRSILNRVYPWAYSYFSQVIQEDSAACTNCGRPVHSRVLELEGSSLGLQYRRSMYIHCDACGEGVSASLGGLVLSLPEVQRFWRRHSRIRTLPGSEVEAGGQPALVIGLESLTSAAGLDVVCARDNFEVLGALTT